MAETRMSYEACMDDYIRCIGPCRTMRAAVIAMARTYDDWADLTSVPDEASHAREKARRLRAMVEDIDG